MSRRHAARERAHGLRRAVELVEAGQADVVVVAYFDRLVRSLAVQAEVVERVERAGGAILAVDVGEVARRHRLPLAVVDDARHGRRVPPPRRPAERTAGREAPRRRRGVPPFPNVPPGYRRGEDGRLEPHPKEATVVADAFGLRADGATVMEVREHLRAARHRAHLPRHAGAARVADRARRAALRRAREQDVAPGDRRRATSGRPCSGCASPRGRRAKSERLLARLGVLRCATCGARMVDRLDRCRTAKRYYVVPLPADRRLPAPGDGQRRHRRAGRRRGGAGAARRDRAAPRSGRRRHRRRRAELERAEQELDAAVRAFTGLDDVDAARDRLLELREHRDAARDRLAELQAAAAPAVTVTAGDWDVLTLDEQRALIRAVIDRADRRSRPRARTASPSSRAASSRRAAASRSVGPSARARGNRLTTHPADGSPSQGQPPASANSGHGRHRAAPAVLVVDVAHRQGLSPHARWHLDHSYEDRSLYFGPAHASCSGETAQAASPEDQLARLVARTFGLPECAAWFGWPARGRLLVSIRSTCGNRGQETRWSGSVSAAPDVVCGLGLGGRSGSGGAVAWRPCLGPLRCSRPLRR